MQHIVYSTVSCGLWQVLLELLFAVAKDDDLALLADVDEIASPDVVHMLRRCAVLQSAAAPEAPHKLTLQACSPSYITAPLHPFSSPLSSFS